MEKHIVKVFFSKNMTQSICKKEVEIYRFELGYALPTVNIISEKQV